MEEKVRLADIYIRIYNKRPLTLEDLQFLAKYDRECFEKTYRNLLYHIPEAKQREEAQQTPAVQENESSVPKEQPEASPPQPDIDALFDRIRQIKAEEMPVLAVNAEDVKHLLGSLYMELLFPHNDRHRYFQLEDPADEPVFNQKA